MNIGLAVLEGSVKPILPRWFRRLVYREAPAPARRSAEPNLTGPYDPETDDPEAADLTNSQLYYYRLLKQAYHAPLRPQ